MKAFSELTVHTYLTGAAVRRMCDFTIPPCRPAPTPLPPPWVPCGNSGCETAGVERYAGFLDELSLRIANRCKSQIIFGGSIVHTRSRVTSAPSLKSV